MTATETGTATDAGATERPGPRLGGRRTLYAVYDFYMSPITFDVLQFVQLAEMYRVAGGFDGVSFIFVMGPNRQFRMMTPKDQALPAAEKYWRLRNIHLQAAWLLQACTGVQFVADRREAQRTLNQVPRNQLFPPDYALTDPKWSFMVANVIREYRRLGVSPLAFSASDSALHHVDRWIEHQGITKPIVALTLRCAEVESDRNARREDWMAFARTIREEGYDPVFVPDTDQAMIATTADYDTEFPHYWPGPVNLELRTALYRRAHIAMSDNGAAAFIHHWMPDSNSIVFQPPSKVPGVFRATREGQAGIERVLGIKVGEQFPFCLPTQRLVWDEDVYDNILLAFRNLEDLIRQRDGAPNGQPEARQAGEGAP